MILDGRERMARCAKPFSGGGICEVTQPFMHDARNVGEGTPGSGNRGGDGPEVAGNTAILGVERNLVWLDLGDEVERW